MHCPSGSANNVDGVEDFGSFGRFQVAEVLFYAAYQPTDAVDLCVAGSGLDAGPFFEFGGGGDAFTVRQQLVEVGAEFGEVGDVGAEVSAAGAAEPEWAGAAPCPDVAGFGAVAERHRDLADPLPGSVAVQESVDAAPESPAGPIELVGREGVNGGAGAFLGDAVIGLGGREVAVSHEVSEHIDGCAGIGVALDVAYLP
jgi:hypothetical protein